MAEQIARQALAKVEEHAAAEKERKEQAWENAATPISREQRARCARGGQIWCLRCSEGGLKVSFTISKFSFQNITHAHRFVSSMPISRFDDCQARRRKWACVMF